mmetsp:Transcript_35833/g.85852  ORF Transcript_35833/g.85852 Transcript_35833/m.85852 type:complete len:312 (-) Transcript_35833:1463-2398(-)
MQHSSAPPGAASQLAPPHCPQAEGQHADAPPPVASCASRSSVWLRPRKHRPAIGELTTSAKVDRLPSISAPGLLGLCSRSALARPALHLQSASAVAFVIASVQVATSPMAAAFVSPSRCEVAYARVSVALAVPLALAARALTAASAASFASCLALRRRHQAGCAASWAAASSSAASLARFSSPRPASVLASSAAPSAAPLALRAAACASSASSCAAALARFSARASTDIRSSRASAALRSAFFSASFFSSKASKARRSAFTSASFSSFSSATARIDFSASMRARSTFSALRSSAVALTSASILASSSACAL